MVANPEREPATVEPAGGDSPEERPARRLGAVGAWIVVILCCLLLAAYLFLHDTSLRSVLDWTASGQ
jgi:hypothetical protein